MTDILEFADLIPDSITDCSGSVFYSGREAYTKPSSIYLLGLNPGGDPVARPTETVDWHTRRVIEEMPQNWSAYRDESWRNALPGTSGMQPRVLHLLRKLQLDPGTVPASNIVFRRSNRESTFGSDLSDQAALCWPLHEAVIERLKIQVILCFGKTAGSWVKDRVGAHRQTKKYVEANNRRWSTNAFVSHSGLRVVVATHPSIADWTNPVSDPSPLIAEMLT